MTKVWIGYAHANQVAHIFLTSLLRLTWSDRELIHTIQGVRGYPGSLDMTRNQIVQNFLESDATHLWMLDTDIGFPRGTLERLLEDDRWVVSGLYYTTIETGDEQWETRPAAWFCDSTGLTALEDTSGIRLVDAVGAGCLLIERSVMEQIGSDWFTVMPRTGEDISFCRRLRTAGYLPAVDCDVKLTHYKGIWI